MKKTSTISKSLTLLSVLAVSATPLIALAQTIDKTKIQSYSQGIIDLINTVFVPVLLAIAFIVFVWGIYKYFILGAENESEKMDGRKFALWGIIGFVIIFSVWTLVGVVKDTLGLSAGSNPTPPTFKTTP